MSSPNEIWQVMVNGQVYQADLVMLKDWIGQGRIQPLDKVKKGSLNWIEAQRVPVLREAFVNRNNLPPLPTAPPLPPPMPPFAAPTTVKAPQYQQPYQPPYQQPPQYQQPLAPQFGGLEAANNHYQTAIACPNCQQSDFYDPQTNYCAYCTPAAVEPISQDDTPVSWREVLRLPPAIRFASIVGLLLAVLFFFKLAQDTQNYVKVGYSDLNESWSLLYAAVGVIALCFCYMIGRACWMLLRPRLATGRAKLTIQPVGAPNPERKKAVAQTAQPPWPQSPQPPAMPLTPPLPVEHLSSESRATISRLVEQSIEGKYQLEKLIGKGGMGAVYEATDLRLNRKIAIKIMLGDSLGDRALRRFEREAQALAKLNHPNIITVHDYGRFGSEGAYLVMELAAGQNLREKLKSVGTLDHATAVEYFQQLLEGIKVAHQAGVIHRDLKPENLLIVEPGNNRPIVKILDFGLAKIKQLDLSDSNRLTVPGMVMGTFGYMSPEQLAGEETDERSDIFSLGVIVVETITGKLPFNGKTISELIISMLNDNYKLPGESAEVKALDSVLQRCLARLPKDRFASVAELQTALLPALQQSPPLVTPPSQAFTIKSPRSQEPTKIVDEITRY